MPESTESDQGDGVRSLNLAWRILRYGSKLAALPAVVGPGALLGAWLALGVLGSGGLLSRFLELLGVNGSGDGGLLVGYAGTALGLTLVVAVLRDAVKVVPSLLEYVAAPSLGGLGRAAGLAFAAAFAVTLVLPFFEKTTVDTTVEPRNLSRPAPFLVSVLPHPAPRGGGSSLATFYVTWDQDANLDSLRAGEGQGIDLSPAYEDQLKSLGEGLAACAGDGELIEITVLGMASSSPLVGATEPESRRLNRDLANLRAEVVARELRSVSDVLDIHVVKWESYEQLVAARGFSDRTPEGVYDERRAILTRRAEVRVMRAPRCELFFDLGGRRTEKTSQQ